MKYFSFLVLCFSASVLANLHSVEEGYLVSSQYLDVLKNRPELTIDHVTNRQMEVYGPKGLKQSLETLQIAHKDLTQIGAIEAADYPSYQSMVSTLKSLEKKYPEILKLYSIGKSAKGNDLWVMKISKNVNGDDSRPEFKYIANMHGDEIVGRELMVKLIDHMASGYGADNRLTNMINNYQIHIMPSMNPDGAIARSRGNGNHADLNRDFPDFSTKDNQNTIDNRQPETIAVMNWQKAHHFILSANFHGGAEVVNYPWDTVPDQFPQFDLIKNLSLDYAHDAAYIGTSTTFENGIVNGYKWYEINGGMQDWSIYYHHDIQLTVELTKTKWPSYSQVDYYFEQNKESLLGLIEKTALIKSSYKF